MKQYFLIVVAVFFALVLVSPVATSLPDLPTPDPYPGPTSYPAPATNTPMVTATYPYPTTEPSVTPVCIPNCIPTGIGVVSAKSQGTDPISIFLLFATIVLFGITVFAGKPRTSQF